MNWLEFKTKLQQHTDLHLEFAYAANQWVDGSYHITEIKQAPVVSVDCGGMMNTWTEIIIQLWEPPQKESGRAMQVHKALKIVDIVESKLPLHPKGIVKIEFGNRTFDTRQMQPASIETDGDRLIIHLAPELTQCKALDRGSSCGPADQADSCCATEIQTGTPVAAEDNSSTACCTPGSGCC